MAWEHVQTQLVTIASLPDGWDGEDAPAVEPAILAYAVAMAAEFESHNVTPASFVYLNPDGHIVFHWERAFRCHESLEISAVGMAEVMLTFPLESKQPAVFYDVAWMPVVKEQC